MTGAISATQAQTDFRRITQELSDLQRQIASGVKAQDLQGFGGGASARILSAKNSKAAAEARDSVINQLDARFGLQAAALGQVASSTTGLAQSIREALAASDGRGVSTQLELAFNSIVAALNESWNGHPLFAGERQDGRPIKINSIDQLVGAVTPNDLFDEAQRRQSIDLGDGSPIELSAKASELSQGLFDTLRDLKSMIDANGGVIGQPLTGAQHDQLAAIVETLDGHANSFTNEEGRTGQIQKQLEAERTRLQERSSLLAKEIGDQADADLAAVSVRLNTLMLQYQASAKSFADLSKLSLLNYL